MYSNKIFSLTKFVKFIKTNDDDDDSCVLYDGYLKRCT
jgi:hypothetical protein